MLACVQEINCPLLSLQGRWILEFNKILQVTHTVQLNLITSDLQDDGKCDANSMFCWIRRTEDYDSAWKKLRRRNQQEWFKSFEKEMNGNNKSATAQPPRGQIQPATSSPKSGRKTANRTRSAREEKWQPACCTGLTMDLLIELAKDLNIEVDLYEVEDQLWGGWTVSEPFATVPTLFD